MDKGYPKNQLHQIILAFDLTSLNLNGILNIDFLEIQANSGWWFDEYKTGPHANSWGDHWSKVGLGAPRGAGLHMQSAPRRTFARIA